MPQSGKMVAAGLSAIQAQAIQGLPANTLTATGAAQATALPLAGDINRFTTVAAATGALLPAMNAGDSLVVVNAGANALLLYPPVGGAINSVAVNGSYSIATATPTCIVFCITPLQYSAMQSA